MPLQKQSININFSKGLDKKSDPNQIPLGSFFALKNSVFTVGDRLTKRNGFGALASLPSAASFATTFNGDLTAIGTNIEAYSTGSKGWVTKGSIQPLSLSTLPLIRNNLNQTQSDTAIALNGYICTVYTESNGSTLAHKYAIADSVTGQNIIAPTNIAGADATYGTPKVFLLGNYFIVIYSTATLLKFIAISTTNPSNVTAAANITTSYTPATTLAFDAAVLNSSLYVAWNGAAASGIKMAFIAPNLTVSSTVIEDATHAASNISVTADIQNQAIWVNYYNISTTNGYTLVVDPLLAISPGFPVQTITGISVTNITAAAQSGVMTLFYETLHTNFGEPQNFVSKRSVDRTTATPTAIIVSLRSVGLASKAFIIDSVIYFLAAFKTAFQPTYFLVNGSVSTSASPNVIAKLAYENGGGYLVTGLPSVTVVGSTASVSYLFKDLIEALSDANSAGTITVGGVYSQLGINLASFTLGADGVETAEIGTNLNIGGAGYLTAYDGYSVTEQGFHLWPEKVAIASTATTGGSVSAQIYFYVATYEWTDNQGNAFRSAGSIPVKEDISGSGTSTNTISVNIPTLRVTSKVANPVKIVLYRWSTAQQTFYQVTSIAAPTLNDTTIDGITYVDTLADATILGNNILYTTGGVIENTGAPAASAITLFDDRLWMADAEDRNLLWYSKQVIEATPVEMSDLLTVYVAPTIGATGPTGPVTALSAMDDKLIVFKQNASYYINGAGPDNTGANNQYSPPTFITSMVGCSNQRSIVFQPQGLMFEFASAAGNQIWLLGRNLETQYIGAPVESLMQDATVLSSVAVPGTNHVRFNLSNGTSLMYDYYYGQWGSFTINGVSSVVYQGLHTYIDPRGAVFQETPGLYLDGSFPVLMSFITGWINPAGISGYQRIFEIQILGQYITPHRLQIQLGYDFGALSEQAIIDPTNFTGVYGSDDVYGQTTPYGGPGTLEQWRIQPATQKCQTFQMSLQEIYDPSFLVPAGAGLTLSGMNCTIGINRSSRPVKAANTIGTG